MKIKLMLLFALISGMFIAVNGNINYNIMHRAQGQNATAPEVSDSMSINNITNAGNAGTAKEANDYGSINKLASTEPSSRDEIINKVSSYDELHTILDRFRNFTDSPISSSVNDPLISKGTTASNSPISIYYSWFPQQPIVKEKYSILMLKFTNNTGELATKRIDYNIIIKNGTNSEFQKNGSTSSGVGLQFIGEGTFTKGSISKPADYYMWINVSRFNDKIINEHTQPLKVTVTSNQTL
jgi:hypothetical protein